MSVDIIRCWYHTEDQIRHSNIIMYIVYSNLFEVTTSFGTFSTVTLHLAYSVFAYSVFAFSVLAYSACAYSVFAYSVFAYPVLAYSVLTYSLTFPCSPIPCSPIPCSLIPCSPIPYLPIPCLPFAANQTPNNLLHLIFLLSIILQRASKVHNLGIRCTRYLRTSCLGCWCPELLHFMYL